MIITITIDDKVFPFSTFINK